MATEPRIIVMERVESSGEYSKDWWEKNMPEDAVWTPTVRYRKVGVKSFDIFNIIEILDTTKECIIEFHNGKTIVVQGSFAKVYDAWIEAEEYDDDEDDLILGL